VRNLAGQPVRTITPGRKCEPGLNTFAWSGVSDAGLRAPNGPYVVEVVALTDKGAQSRAIAVVTLRR